MSCDGNEIENNNNSSCSIKCTAAPPCRDCMIDSAASEAVPLKIYILRPPLIKAFADRDPSLRPPFSSTTAPRQWCRQCAKDVPRIYIYSKCTCTIFSDLSTLEFCLNNLTDGRHSLGVRRCGCRWLISDLLATRCSRCNGWMDGAFIARVIQPASQPAIDALGLD